MKKVLIVEGMHCKHCAASVSGALESVEGVSGVKINLKKKTATVNVGKNTVCEQAMRDAVKNAGFEVVSIEDKKTLF